VRLVGVIDNDRERLTRLDRLEPAGNALERCDPGCDRVVLDAEQPRDGDGREHVLDVEAAAQLRPQLDPAGPQPRAVAVELAQLRSAASSISRKARWRSIASGVVRIAGRRSPPIRLSIVPSRPGRRPAAPRIEWRRNVVVVLPFVPVTPATSSVRVGSSKKTTAAWAIALRASSTTSCETSSSSTRS